MSINSVRNNMSKGKQITDQPSFTSYIGENGQVKDGKKSRSTFYDVEVERGYHTEPSLMSGEAIVSTARNVTRYTYPNYGSSQASGVVGVLHVTNFRLTFCIATGQNEERPQRNKLVNEDDIVLNCVDTIFQVSKSKRKKLLPSSGATGTIKTIEIHCKDFQHHSFGFKMCPKIETVKTVNALVHHSFPVRLDLLFAFDYQIQSDSVGSDSEGSKFTQESDWQNELERLGTQSSKVTGFKVLFCNTNFQICESLPEVMVVPETLDLPDLKKFANHFVDYRWPVWSYSYKNGASLVRMAKVIPKATDTDIEERMYEKIRLTHPRSRKPKIVDFTEMQQTTQELPSLKEIQSCYEKLKELCRPCKKKELSGSDNSWLSDLEGSGWLLVVYKCLKLSVRCVNTMVDKSETIVLKENNSRDLTPLITCLVQLMLDPHFRTIQGFQSLVEKEWVALGHPFTQKMGLLLDSDQCPLFVLFLDCVWQLTLQFPSAFQFSDVYLVSLWDTVCLGLFDNFIFDSVRNRQTLTRGFRQYSSAPIKFMSAWDWSRQFDKEYLALLYNPLYVARTELHLKIPSSNTGTTSTDHCQIKRVYSKKLSEIYEPVPKQNIQVLKPVISAPLIKLWSHCYLRWINDLEIMGGGTPSCYLQQCMLVEEIICLKHQVHSLETHTEFIRSARPRSDLVFSFDVAKAKSDEQTLSVRWSENVAITSSFPYRSAGPHSSKTAASMNLFLENSFIQDSDNEYDAESVDGLDYANDSIGSSNTL